MSCFLVKEFLAVVIVVVSKSVFQFRITILTCSKCLSEKQLLKGSFVASFLKPKSVRFPL